MSVYDIRNFSRAVNFAGVIMMQNILAVKEDLDSEFIKNIEELNNNPFLSSLMDAMSGFVAILDENRQILNMNDPFLKEFGFNNLYEIVGSFPGDVFGCVYAKTSTNNCGNTKYCSTCGAGVAIKKCIKTGEAQDRICALKQSKNGREHDYCFRVKCSPINFDDKKFFLIFIQDITKSYINSYLERVFYHDLNNILSGLYGLSELFKISPDIDKNIKRLENISLRLKNEIDAQRLISKTITGELDIEDRKISANSFLSDLEILFESHPAARAKKLEFSKGSNDIYFYSNYALLYRVLVNMIVNGLEASDVGESVQIWIDKDNNRLRFNVWNRSHIPKEVKIRIFQKFFSTKQVEGRGLGTFSMKLFGESFLKGKVDFESSPESGTRFWISINI